MKKVFVLAGGFGKRLKSVVSDVPKPLAPVENTPFLIYLLKNCISQGASEIVLLLYFEAQKIQNMIDKMHDDAELYGVDIKVIVEPEPLGTGGAILNAMTVLNVNEPVIVINSDTWLSNGLSLLDSTPAPAIAAVKSDNYKRYGSLKVDKGKVKSFREKLKTDFDGWINAGMYLLSREDFFNLVPGSSFSLEEQVLPKLASLGKLEALLLETDFIDIGIPEDYFRFCNWIKKNKEIEL